MQRTFCDNCNNELTRSVTKQRIVRRYNQFTLEVMVSFKNVLGDGDLCEACALKILSTGNAVELPYIIPSPVDSPAAAGGNR